MKNKIHLIFLILLSIIFVNITKALENTIAFEQSKIFNIENINNIIGFEKGYIVLENYTDKTKIYRYNHKYEQEITKEFDSLKNSNIIKYNDTYLIVGIKSNTLKIYLIDSNFKVISQQDTSYIIDQSSVINLYQSNDNILVVLTEENELSNNNIYEIDKELNVTENGFSSYDGNLIKAALKSDYYLISDNNQEIDNNIINYQDSTYNEDKIILVGDINPIELNSINSKKAYLTIKDYNNQNIVNKEFEEYTSLNSVKLIKDKLIILASKETEYYILICDLNGNILSEDKINIEIVDAVNLFKVSNKILITKNASNQIEIDFYKFKCEIYKEENIYGTTNIESYYNPYEIVTFEIKPNSGYEVENIIIKDNQGNIINNINNSFIMPENDVKFIVNYKEQIINPETYDKILLIICLSILTILITIKLYKKLKWLK